MTTIIIGLYRTKASLYSEIAFLGHFMMEEGLAGRKERVSSTAKEYRTGITKEPDQECKER
jgi:hypothetical protein